MFLIYAFLLIFQPLSAIDYYEEGKLAAHEIQKDPSAFEKKIMKQQLALVKMNKVQSTEIEIGKEKRKCLVSPSTLSNNVEASLYVFVSFSLSEEIWLTLSRDVAKVGGILVLRGLPDNSFKLLAQKIHALKQKGAIASVQIDPKLFSKFEVKNVPCFVAVTNDDFDKLTGNVSLKYALEKMENENAKKLRKLL